MTEINDTNGRFCNLVFRNVAVSIIAEKFNLQVNYARYEQMQKLGIPLFSGSCTYICKIGLSDYNYFEILDGSNLASNLNANEYYFQSPKPSARIHAYLKSHSTDIILKNKFKERYNANNDCIIHIRLTDVENKNPGYNYYISAIRQIEFNDLYITTDDTNHSIITQIKQQYPLNYFAVMR